MLASVCLFQQPYAKAPGGRAAQAVARIEEIVGEGAPVERGADVQEARNLGYLLTGIARILDGAELKERIAALEQQAERKRR